MTVFDHRAFHAFIHTNHVFSYKDPPIKLKSGQHSPYYINWRRVCDNADLVDRLTDFILAFIAEQKLVVGTLYGVPEGGSILGVISQFKWACQSSIVAPVVLGRSTQKAHGDPQDRFFIGQPKDPLIVIEDVVTTGESLQTCLATLASAGHTVSAVISLTDRQADPDGPDSLASQLRPSHIHYYPMTTLHAIVRSQPDAT